MGKTSINAIEFDNLTADPTTLTESLTWYRSDLNELRSYINGAILVLNAGNAAQWLPNSVPLDSLLPKGATFFINGGAGVYLSFSGTADDAVHYNDSLSNGLPYDGSNLAMKLHCRLSSNGGAGDTVGLIVNYAITKNGDNTSTTVTNIPQQNVDVSTELQDVQFEIVLGTMTGVVGGEILLFSLTRNSKGGGSDSYGGNLEVLAMELIKI